MIQSQADCDLSSTSPAQCESILCTEELATRPSRPPNYEIEIRALQALGKVMADAPLTVVQKLADTILEVLKADSAGISLLTTDEKRFYWPAISGEWKSHIGGGTPRDFGPCGDVLDRNMPLMMKHVERRYSYFAPVQPLVEECILAPFYIQGKAVGTVWAVAHDPKRKFDAEDMRLLVTLSEFASSAYQVTDTLARLKASQAEAEAANNNKDLFVAALSHELRTPLSPVILAVTAMQVDPSLSEDSKYYVEMIRRNVDLEVRLIDDLLDVSRAVSGKLRLAVMNAHTHELINFANEICASDILRKKIKLVVNLDATNDRISADDARIQQVFCNLLKNATKFSSSGQTIEVHTSNPTPDTIAIRINDYGIGIDAHVIPRLFKPFEQGTTETTQKFGGLGLGLAISKAIVELHGGTIRAASDGKDRGATFTIELPLSEKEARLTVSAAAGEPDSDRLGLRLLVVEDHADTATVLELMLNVAGHIVTTAPTADAALKAVAAEPFDLVISDVGLPDATGYELMEQIRDRHQIKGIAMTGYGMEEDFKRSQDAGFVAHIVKPVNIDQLLRVIRQVVAK